MTTVPAHPWPTGTLVEYAGRKVETESYYPADEEGPEAYDLTEPGTMVTYQDQVLVEKLTWIREPGPLRMPTAKEVLAHIGSEALGGWGDGPVEFDTFDPTELPEEHRGVLIGRGPDGQRIWVEIAVTKIEESDL